MSGCNLNVIEEVVLARNRTAHPEHITDLHSSYSQHDLTQMQRPFFISEVESKLFSDPDEKERRWLIAPQIEVTEEQLRMAAGEVRKLS